MAIKGCENLAKNEASHFNSSREAQFFAEIPLKKSYLPVSSVGQKKVQKLEVKRSAKSKIAPKTPKS